MTVETDDTTTPTATANAVLIGRVALAAGLIPQAITKAASATDADTIIGLLEEIAEYADTIRDTAADMADAMGCGREAVEAVKAGMARVEAFRGCTGLEGSA
jgi:hypothetical protein